MKEPQFEPCPICECDPCDCETLYTFPAEDRELEEDAAEVLAYMETLDRLDRWLWGSSIEDDAIAEANDRARDEANDER